MVSVAKTSEITLILLCISHTLYIAGYLTGSEDYYSHRRCDSGLLGQDLRDNINHPVYFSYTVHCRLPDREWGLLHCALIVGVTVDSVVKISKITLIILCISRTLQATWKGVRITTLIIGVTVVSVVQISEITLIILCISRALFIAGYLTGSEDYYSHRRCDSGFCGQDLRDNTNPTYANGSYSTELFAEKVINIVKNHKGDKVSYFDCVYIFYDIRIITNTLTMTLYYYDNVTSENIVSVTIYVRIPFADENDQSLSLL